mmetsp:Transcript_44297/g.62183  ORF Transcript_44297/g.62183 Transcript_44297/m.62183 type:complete len:247 (-) Transcript_44297:137-877(-)
MTFATGHVERCPISVITHHCILFIVITIILNFFKINRLQSSIKPNPIKPLAQMKRRRIHNILPTTMNSKHQIKETFRRIKFKNNNRPLVNKSKDMNPFFTIVLKSRLLQIQNTFRSQLRIRTLNRIGRIDQNLLFQIINNNPFLFTLLVLPNLNNPGHILNILIINILIMNKSLSTFIRFKLRIRTLRKSQGRFPINFGIRIPTKTSIKQNLWSNWMVYPSIPLFKSTFRKRDSNRNVFWQFVFVD